MNNATYTTTTQPTHNQTENTMQGGTDDSQLLKQAVDVLTSADIVNKFTDKVWIAVDRRAWDKFMGEQQ